MLVSCGCNHQRVGEPGIRSRGVSGIFSRQSQTLAELTLSNTSCVKKTYTDFSKALLWASCLHKEELSKLGFSQETQLGFLHIVEEL